MRALPVCCLIVVSACIAANQNEVALLVEIPESKNVSEGTNVTFRCVFSGGQNYTTGIIIAPSNATTPEPMILEPTGNISVTAKFTASLEHNGTIIACNAIRSGQVIESNSSSRALLQVQGRLSAVGDLSIHIMDCSLLINWTAPYTLQGVPILNYTINTTMLPETDMNNETEHWYMYNSPKTVVFTVAAINDVGTGDASNMTITLPTTSASCFDLVSSLTVGQPNTCSTITPAMDLTPPFTPKVTSTARQPSDSISPTSTPEVSCTTHNEVAIGFAAFLGVLLLLSIFIITILFVIIGKEKNWCRGKSHRFTNNEENSTTTSKL